MSLQPIACILVAFLASTLASNQHLICKSVEDVFAEAVGENKSTRGETAPLRGQCSQNLTGPAGPRGLRGPRGRKGDAGQVDYDNISNIVDGKLCEGLTTITFRLNSIRDGLARLHKEIHCFTANGLLYNGTCYRSPDFSTSQHLNNAAAKQSCHNIGYKLANIYDKAQKEALESFLRPRVSGQMHFWIGLTYDVTAKTLRTETGERVIDNQVIWYPNYPRSGSEAKYVLLAIKQSGKDGLFNDVDYTAEGVACEKKLET